jgi:hypothetical protein
MNSMFHEKLNKFVIIYIDDILVYFRIVKGHVKPMFLTKLKYNKFFANRVKSKFTQEGMDFLGHVLTLEVRP